ncbi:hypothetical protein N656DRAFT_777112 [Canariomyces notabilis]|uniref:Uncharacterized protein n=1 Tax=Canariomyces notabilis TaxID=2074819 RepID=A0AAN6TJ87_9PEZI|nr:hypothetical protein N656DRAFT_777112 [Canariomyces arenarius]
MRTEIIANAATSKPPKASPSQQSPGSSGNGETASDLIDTWYTALQPPAEPLPELPSDQVIRSESVLVPPIPPPATGRIRFLAHNPNAWKSLADWSQATTN